jgi:tetratricopeptide (TPR) repeat protein
MEDSIEHIEKYLLGKLSDSERETFEMRMREDKKFSRMVENHRSLLRGIEIGFNKEIKNMLKDEESAHAGSLSSRKTKFYSIRMITGVAAAILIVLILAYFLRPQKTTPTEIFADYYSVYPNIEIPISRSEEIGTIAYSAYEKGKYSSALNEFLEIKKENPDNPAPYFYAGICQIELNRPEEAIRLFREVQDLDTSKYTIPSMWYEALSYLKTGNQEEAAHLLTALSTKDSSYAQKAQEIIKTLRIE